MAQIFIDNLTTYLEGDVNTSQWLLPLEPLMHSSYAHRFRSFNGAVRFLVYDDTLREEEKWMTALEFYERSIAIVNDYIRRGYYEDLNHADVPTGE
jgi:hypothetical protein